MKRFLSKLKRRLLPRIEYEFIASDGKRTNDAQLWYGDTLTVTVDDGTHELLVVKFGWPIRIRMRANRPALG